MNPSLSQVITNLVHAPEVRGVFRTGTTASTLGPSSDIDLVVVLDACPEGIRSANTRIEGRFADIFFFDVPFVERLAGLESVAINGFEGMFLTWLAKGAIEKDAMGQLASLQKSASAKLAASGVTQGEKEACWFKINYNFIANKRYRDSDDPLYHKALELRLLYSVPELIVSYFTLRDIPWRGEKEAISYLEAQDPATFEIFTAYTKSSSLPGRFALYEQVFERVLHGEFGRWKEDFLLIKNEQNQLNKTSVPFVRRLLGE